MILIVLEHLGNLRLDILKDLEHLVCQTCNFLIVLGYLGPVQAPIAGQAFVCIPRTIEYGLT